MPTRYKTAIIGATGQLGMDLLEVFSDLNPVPLGHGDIEIANLDSIRLVLDRHQPDLVVNTASFHNVPRCEQEPARAFEINALACRSLARTCSEMGLPLLHVSTDYVFSGRQRSPYREDDLPGPRNTYGLTKLAGEHYIQAEWRKSWIVRSSGLYGKHPCRAKQGENFVRTMLRLAAEKPELRVVNDETLTPTSTLDLARQIRRIVETDLYGVIHATAHGQCSWYEFTCEIMRLAGRQVSVNPTTAAEFGSPVKRPPYSVLDNTRLREAGIDIMRHWKDDLREYMKEIGELRNG